MATLIIKDKKEFDQQVWQLDAEWDTNEQYNDWMKRASDALQRIYNAIEDVEEIDSDDFYTMGDVINMLNNVNVDAEPQAEAWVVSMGDFEDKYDCDVLDYEQKRVLCERASHIMQNDGMAEYYWLAIEAAAEEAGLKERTPIAHYAFVDKETGERFSGTFKLDEEHEDGAFDDGRKIWSHCFSSAQCYYEIMLVEGDDVPSAYRVIDGENHDEQIEEQDMWIE